MLNHLHERFAGVSRLYSQKALANFSQAKVCVVGLGGVGSWTVEALARSGIGNLILIDRDYVAASNINRQIQAIEPNLGKAKAQTLTARIATINPTAIVTPLEAVVEADTVATLIDPSWDWIVDCIDGAKNKAALIAHCWRLKLNLVSSGGAGGRSDPSQVRIADLSHTAYDPLLAKTRARLRREHGLPEYSSQGFGIPCVYSDEIPNTARVPNEDGLTQDGSIHNQPITNTRSQHGYGTVVTVTATFGLMAALLVLNRLATTRA